MTSSVYRDSKHRAMAMCVLGLLLCLSRAGSAGAAVVVGDARTGDQRWLDADPGLRAHYDAWAAARPMLAGDEPA